MEIQLYSDLHLDVGGYQDLPGGEVLILAGDICEAKTLCSEFRQTKTVDRKPGTYPCWDFFEYAVTKYEKVFYVLGNHEHYRGRFGKTYSELQEILPKNVTLLEDQCEEYKGVMFMGSTLWTDLNRGDPVTAWHLKSSMNDYKTVTHFYANRSVYYKLTPEVTAETHFKTKQYFKTMLELNRDKPFVVITHHAPSFASVGDKYKHDTTMNGGYASNMDEFILDNPNIKLWIHGHMHDPVDYMIGSTRILSNPRGYVGYEDTSQFNPNFKFTV